MSATVTAVPPRAEVPIEETWALESVFVTDDAWEAGFTGSGEQLRAVEAFRGRIAEGPATLLAALRAADDLTEAVSKVLVYALLRRSEDATNASAGEMADRAIGLASRAEAAGSFLGPEIAALADETIADWITQEPDLAPYRHALNRISRLRTHIRSVEVEEILARASEVAAASEITQSVLEAGELPLGQITDESGQTVRLAQGNLSRFLDSPNRRVRQEAWEVSADAYLAFRNTFATTLTGAVKRDVFYARARGYDSSLDAALAGDDIPREVFHNLLDTVWKHLPVWHRYFSVRRRLLGLAEGDLHGYDLEAPLAEQPSFPWERGVETILASLAPLGAEYVAEVRRGLAERWTDRSANLGKGGGAFSGGTFGTEPFISMTWRDTLTSVSTLAHELGHSMHSLLTWKNQPVTYSRYGMSAAETASNLNQALMGAYMLAERDDRDWTIAVIEERMENFMRYLFTMPILARFELAAHERVEAGGALSPDWMSQTLLGFYREGYGSEVVIDPARMGITWARFSHLFMNFYVFQYGIGIAAAAALSEAILTEGEPARERYLTFLRAGGSVDPIVALRDAGIDMSSPEPIERAFALMSGYVDRLEAFAP
ncbi:MAG: Oligoendopeptidase [Thermomicrobiales bacterium]|jgi:oligoendopeptidase F|nr:Oligoendopeptidase [Thermomicrobiales bacterium]